MSRTIQYFFSLHSPWTYLGNAFFHEIARKHGCAIDYKPMPLRSVFDETGGVQLAKRHPVRQRYRLVELQRWRERRGMPLVPQPRFFPFDPSLADRVAIALVLAGDDPSAFIADVMAGVWAREDDMREPAAVAASANRAGFSGEALLEQAEDPRVLQRYEATLSEAVEAGVFGAPSYVLDGEVFWGQDRLELLDSALGTGRGAYSPDGAV